MSGAGRPGDGVESSEVGWEIFGGIIKFLTSLTEQ